MLHTLRILRGISQMATKTVKRAAARKSTRAPETGVGRNTAVTDEEVKKAWATYVNSDYNLTTAAVALGISEKSLRRRVAHAQLRFKLEKPSDADIRAVKNYTDLGFTRDKLRVTMAELSRVNDELEKFKRHTKAGYEPADWTLSGRRGKSGLHMPILFVSDAQVGEVIDPAEVEYGRGYNTSIFRERYRKLIDTVIYLSTEHIGADWSFNGIIYIRGGDAISGGIHEELAETDDLTPQMAVRVVFEEEAAGIEKLAEAFGRVDVKSVSGGNHDRDTFKTRTKKRVDHSYDAMIDFMLAHHFRDDKRVTFQLTRSTDVTFPIFDKQGLATHGDNIGAGGGTGFIGPAATIIKGVAKVMMEQQQLGRMIDHVYVGHFHTFGHSRQYTSNGCFPGYSEFAKRFRMRPEPPMQVLQYWHKKHGMVDFKPIIMP